MQSKAHYKPRIAGTTWVPLVPDSVEIFKGLPGRWSWTTGATCYHSTEVTSLWDLLSLLLHRGHSSPCPGSLSDFEKMPQCAFSDPSNSESIGLPLSTCAWDKPSKGLTTVATDPCIFFHPIREAQFTVSSANKNCSEAWPAS